MVDYPPRHLNPVEKGMSSGRTPPVGVSAHLVVADLGEDYPAREKGTLLAGTEVPLPRAADKETDKQLRIQSRTVADIAWCQPWDT